MCAVLSSVWFEATHGAVCHVTWTVPPMRISLAELHLSRFSACHHVLLLPPCMFVAKWGLDNTEGAAGERKNMMRNGFGEIILRNMSKSGPVQVLMICHCDYVSWVYREQDAVNDSLFAPYSKNFSLLKAMFSSKNLPSPETLGRMTQLNLQTVCFHIYLPICWMELFLHSIGRFGSS